MKFQLKSLVLSISLSTTVDLLVINLFCWIVPFELSVINSQLEPNLTKRLSKSGDGFNKKNLLQQYNELRKYYDTKVTLISDASSKVAILKAQLQDIDKKINDLLNYDLAPADIPLAKDVMERYE